MTATPAQSNRYLKYSGMSIQLFALVGIGAWLGQKTDAYVNTSKPYFTILFILLFTTGFFYKLVKDLGRKDES